MATTPSRRPARVATPDEAVHGLLEGISWRSYESLLRDFDRGGSNVRITYDRGRLEFMSPAGGHERRKKRLARMVEALTEELNIPIASGGSTTLRRKLERRGLEPDECYWVAHEPRMRDKDEIDLDVDPAPDLAIEVENTRRLLDRLGIYAALGFPEIWRDDGSTVTAGRLQPGGTYLWGDSSGVFPFLPMAEVARFLALAETQDETTWIRSFRAWVRAELAPRHARPDVAR